jgi:hypothetical protein
MGLFHGLPRDRTGDVPSAGKPCVKTADPAKVIADQSRVCSDSPASKSCQAGILQPDG